MKAWIVNAVTIFILLLANVSGASAQDGRAPVAPNIVFILADDLDRTLVPHMPKTAQLIASRGMSFPNYYVVNSLCCSSRASILRSQYVHSHQVYSNNPPLGGFFKFFNLGLEQSTLATWLQAGGYQTALYGKYLNGYPLMNARRYVPPGWNDWFGGIGRPAYKGFNYLVVDNGKIEDFGDSRGDFITDVMGRRASRFIHSSKVAGRPFFIYLAPFSPHLPATSAPRHRRLFNAASLSLDPSFDEVDVSDKPLYIRSRKRLERREKNRLTSIYRKRLRAVQSIDDLVEKIVQTLTSEGVLEQTYIFFSSDNGVHLGEHRLPFGKRTPYETDINVPLFIRGPGIPEGVQSEALVTELDLGPTFADLGAVVPPEFVEGRSLIPLLTAAATTEFPRKSFLFDYYTDVEEYFESVTNGESVTVPPYRALHTKDTVYVEYVTGEREFYDLTEDPFQLENRFADSRFVLPDGYASNLEALATCKGAGCRSAEELPLAK